jgi:hypothetical protein
MASRADMNTQNIFSQILGAVNLKGKTPPTPLASLSGNTGFRGEIFSNQYGILGEQPGRSPTTEFGNTPDHLFTGSPLYPGLAATSNKYVRFYVAVWKTVTDCSPENFGILVGSADEIIVADYYSRLLSLLFNNKEDQEKFFAWHARYKERFGEDTWCSSFFPVLSEGRVNGYAIKAHETNSLDSIGDAIAEWSWIVSNTHDGVSFWQGMWVFQNEAEMLMFKLRK